MDHHQRLLARVCDGGGHQPPPHGQLVQPGLGNVITSCCGNDASIRRALGISQHAIAKNQMHIVHTQWAQVVTGFFMQSAQALNAVNLGRHMAEHGRLVAAAGANLQHPAQFSACSLAQQLNHPGHHIGFGDGLTQAYGQAGVFIGLTHQRTFHKSVALHQAHGLQHTRIAHALLGQQSHHACTHRSGI